MTRASCTASSRRAWSGNKRRKRAGTNWGWWSGAAERTIGDMFKRALAAFLWFAMVWVAYEIVWSLTDVPRIAGPVIAFTVAALVTLDPLALFWPRAASTDDASSRAIARSGFKTPASPAG